MRACRTACARNARWKKSSSANVHHGRGRPATAENPLTATSPTTSTRPTSAPAQLHTSATRCTATATAARPSSADFRVPITSLAPRASLCRTVAGWSRIPSAAIFGRHGANQKGLTSTGSGGRASQTGPAALSIQKMEREIMTTKQNPHLRVPTQDIHIACMVPRAPSHRYLTGHGMVHEGAARVHTTAQLPLTPRTFHDLRSAFLETIECDQITMFRSATAAAILRLPLRVSISRLMANIRIADAIAIIIKEAIRTRICQVRTGIPARTPRFESQRSTEIAASGPIYASVNITATAVTAIVTMSGLKETAPVQVLAILAILEILASTLSP